METIWVHAPKGGMFVSTFVAAAGNVAASHGLSTAIVTTSQAGMCDVLGVSRPTAGTTRVADNLSVFEMGSYVLMRNTIGSWPDSEFDVVLVDAGVALPEPGDGRTVVLTRGCYLACAHMARNLHHYMTTDAWLFVSEPDRALTETDVARAVFSQPPLAVLFQDPLVARAVDAGLLTSRTPAALRDAVHCVLDAFVPAYSHQPQEV